LPQNNGQTDNSSAAATSAKVKVAKSELSRHSVESDEIPSSKYEWEDKPNRISDSEGRTYGICNHYRTQHNMPEQKVSEV